MFPSKFVYVHESLPDSHFGHYGDLLFILLLLKNQGVVFMCAQQMFLEICVCALHFVM
jgi:hypothetical protein